MNRILTGSDVLAASRFSDLHGFRIGFVGNHTSRLGDGRPSHVVLHEAPGVQLVRLFSPEHGAFGVEDHEDVGNDVDPVTRLPIQSLYGAHRKPTAEMLDGLDALVFEIQDVGARFYTYSSTLLLCLEAAHENGLRLFVLDRPNPITGTHVEGPIADDDKLSFTACHTIPVRHGLTLGELARLAGGERGMSGALTVIPCDGWTRDMWWDETGLGWVNPSPAMRSLDAAIVYPGVCLLEQTNVSVGRGTEMPFMCAGAPWIDSERWASLITADCGPGVKARPTTFRPAISKFAGELCHGVELSITDRDELDSVRLGIAMVMGPLPMANEEFRLTDVNRLLASDAMMDFFEARANIFDILDYLSQVRSGWKARVEPWLLY